MVSGLFVVNVSGLKSLVFFVCCIYVVVSGWGCVGGVICSK